MRKLSKYEKETIINWNEAENLASVYTFNASLKRRLAEFSRKYPLLCRLERSTPEGSVTVDGVDVRQMPQSTLRGLLGSEMCIRDRHYGGWPPLLGAAVYR